MNDINVKSRTKAKDKGEQTMKAPNKPWEIDVDVYLNSVGPPVDFDIRACLPVDANDKLIFNNKGRRGFMISFHLYDNTNNGAGSGYVFHNPHKQPNRESEWALWSRDLPGCPPQNYGQWDEFTSQSVKNQGQTLVVENKNETITEFGYTLRVTNDNGASFVDLDPGGLNQNGNAL